MQQREPARGSRGDRGVERRPRLVRDVADRVEPARREPLDTLESRPHVGQLTRDDDLLGLVEGERVAVSGEIGEEQERRVAVKRQGAAGELRP